MRYLGRTLAIAGALALTASSSVLAQDASTAPGSAETVVAPGGDPLGVPYGEWAGRWWAWLLGVPAAESPLLNDNCQAGQGGDVFFIPHTFGGSTVETTCEIGADQWILASAGSVLQTDSGGETAAELATLAEGERPSFSELAVTIDGVDVPEIDSYWVVSPGVPLTLGEDNLFEAEPGTTLTAVTGGWFVMIPPMEPGTHTIVVRDVADDTTTAEDDPATAQLTANITVAAPA